MFLYFLSAIKNQPEDKDVQKYWDSLKTDNNGKVIWTGYDSKKIRAPPNNSELSYELFRQVTTPPDRYPKQPNYALNKEQIDKITSIIEKQYPLFYEWLLQARRGYTKEMTQNEQ
jgi:hypothetical protein